jgi:hypothetical protein
VKSQSRTVRTAPTKSYPGTARGRASRWMRARKSAKPATGAAAATTGAGSRRKFCVFVSLLGLLSLTSVLLLALAPAPLTQGTATSLFAIDQPRSMDAVFETAVPVTKQRWKSIFVHHSGTTSGNADTLAARSGGLADHFLIGNGSGCMDGEVQMGHRWSGQLPAGEVPGTRSIASDCITICVVGDFDHSQPTPTQRLRLAQLVTTLQSRLGVSAGQVYLHQGTGTAADVGSRFPVASFREQLLP